MLKVYTLHALTSIVLWIIERYNQLVNSERDYEREAFYNELEGDFLHTFHPCRFRVHGV